jgi:hypothetical protein
MSSVSNARIILHFDVHEPVELMDLTLSFGALAKQYRKYLVSRLDLRRGTDADVKLYITKIENNCILAELAGAINVMGSLVPVMEYTNIFIEFVNNINNTITYFRGIASRADDLKPSDIDCSKTQCEDTANFLNVVSQNKGGNLGISVAEYKKEDGTIKHHIKFTFTSEEAAEARKGALIAQRALEYRGDADYKDVLMYFHQTNVEDPKSQGRTGQRATIRSVSEKPLPVYFISDIDKDRVKSFTDDPTKNPFKASYRVDVNVEKDRMEIPKFYRILRLHEILPAEDEIEG